MKLNYKIGKISFLILIITILLSVYLNFFAVENNFTKYLYGITVNILASSFFGLMTSIVYYNFEKVKVQKKLLHFCGKIIRNFSNIEYVENINYCNFKQYKMINDNDEFNHLNNNEKRKKYEAGKISYENYINDKITEQIKKYINFYNLDLSEFWELEKEIDILNNKTTSYKLLKSIFDYTYEIRNKILEYKYHFDEYLKATNGNVKFNYNLISQLQSSFFDIVDEYNYTNFIPRRISDDLIYSQYYDYNTGKYYYLVNKVIKQYDHWFAILSKKISDK